jgi:two-component system phosphate regulon sensor histidine kinase PhoR
VEFLGRARGEIVGRPLEELFTQTDVLALHAVAAGGRARRAQVRFARQGGVRVHQVSASPARVEGMEGEGTPATGSASGSGSGSASGPRPTFGVVLTLRDVTELSSAVQLKTDFVANASHELRTPLSSLKGAIETLTDTGPEDEPIRQRLFRMLADNVARLEELTRDLLDLSRLESPDAPREIAPVRVADIPDLLLRDFGGVCAERRLAIAFDLAPGVDHIETDPKLLLLVLKNLVDNATKFAYEGSTVRVAARPLPPGEAGKRRGVRWEVIDRGVGIPLNAQQRIFERFYQVDVSRSGLSHRRGSGLGLAIVKHAVKLLGGTISVSSVWKEGTTMTVDLPDCLAESALPASEAPRAADAAA